MKKDDLLLIWKADLENTKIRLNNTIESIERLMDTTKRKLIENDTIYYSDRQQGSASDFEALIAKYSTLQRNIYELEKSELKGDC